MGKKGRPRHGRYPILDPRMSYKRVFLIEVPQSLNEKIPELVERFKDEHKRYRIIIAGSDDEHLYYSTYNYFFEDQDEIEECRLMEIAHNFVLLYNG